MTDVLQRVFNIRRNEIAPLLVSTFYFFCVLTALMVLRPARDALGMKRGMDDIRWLFIGTALVTLLANPAFSFLVSKFRRVTFISATYGFFAVSLVGFYALLTFASESVGETSGMVFYVWYSVFNLFCTMVFWALMADRFTLEQSKRLFGTIAVGGTLGAIAGPYLATKLAEPLGTASLLLVSAGFLILAVISAWGVTWIQPDHELQDSPNGATPAHKESVIGGNAWQGITAVFQSRYLMGISAYMLILSIIATLIYFTRLQIVAAQEQGTDQNTTTFAYIDLTTQTATLVLQILGAGHLMRRIGVPFALALLPLTMALGFVGLAMQATLTAVVVLDVIFKAVQRAIMRPARETLFTVVSREDKYKSKAVTDTFVYRTGDVIGAWTEGAVQHIVKSAEDHPADTAAAAPAAQAAANIGSVVAGIATVAVPLSLAWGALGIWLGRQQIQLAIDADQQRDPEAAELLDVDASQSAVKPAT